MQVKHLLKLLVKQILKETAKATGDLIGNKTLKKLYGPFLWMGFNCLKA